MNPVMENIYNNFFKARVVLSNGFYLALLLCFFIINSFSTLSAQECMGDETLLAKWDFDSNTEACNGFSNRRVSYYSNTVPLMVGNQYCPQFNDGCGQTIVFEKGFGNTNDFKNFMCLAGFWKNSGNKYFRAPGYDANSPTYNPNNPSGNVWFQYNFLPGQTGSLTGFSFTYKQSGYRAGGTIGFQNVGLSVWRNGIMVHEDLVPIVEANVNNPANPIRFTFPTTSEFSTDGSTEVVWEIAFALVSRNRSLRTGADDYCIFGVKGAAMPDVTVTPATCIPTTRMNGSLTIGNFSTGEKYDYVQGSTYTGTETFATAPVIPADGIIVNNLPIVDMPTEYTVRVFRSDCYADKTVVLPPTFCPYTCDFPDATVTPNPSTCNGEIMNSDANIVLTNITNMDRVGISSGRTYTGPDYSGATPLGGATTFTFDNSDGVSSGTCTEYYTIRMFNGAGG